MSHRFVQEDARPAGTQDHVHRPGGRLFRLQVHDGLPRGLPREARKPFAVEKEAVLRPAAAAEGTHLSVRRPTPAVFGDARHVQAAERAGVPDDPAFGGSHQDQAVLAGHAGHHLGDPGIVAPGDPINLAQQVNLGLNRHVAGRSRDRIEIAGSAPGVRDGHANRLTRLGGDIARALGGERVGERHRGVGHRHSDGGVDVRALEGPAEPLAQPEPERENGGVGESDERQLRCLDPEDLPHQQVLQVLAAMRIQGRHADLPVLYAGFPQGAVEHPDRQQDAFRADTRRDVLQGDVGGDAGRDEAGSGIDLADVGVPQPVREEVQLVLVGVAAFAQRLLVEGAENDAIHPLHPGHVHGDTKHLDGQLSAGGAQHSVWEILLGPPRIHDRDRARGNLANLVGAAKRHGRSDMGHTHPALQKPHRPHNHRAAHAPCVRSTKALRYQFGPDARWIP